MFEAQQFMQLDHHHRPTLDSVLLSHTSFGHDLSVQFTYCLMVCFRSECPFEKYCAAVAVHHKHCSVNFFHSIVCSISVFVTSHHLRQRQRTTLCEILFDHNQAHCTGTSTPAIALHIATWYTFNVYVYGCAVCTSVHFARLYCCYCSHHAFV